MLGFPIINTLCAIDTRLTRTLALPHRALSAIGRAGRRLGALGAVERAAVLVGSCDARRR